MAQEPKRRHSIARKGKRRAAIKLSVAKSAVCKNCQSFYMPHTVCANCGYYNGKQVLNTKSKKENSDNSQSQSA